MLTEIDGIDGMGMLLQVEVLNAVCIQQIYADLLLPFQTLVKECCSAPASEVAFSVATAARLMTQFRAAVDPLKEVRALS